MIVKNGQIIAIGNVNTGGTLSGNGLSESPLGLRDDAVKLTPASSGIDIKKIVAEDGKIEYQLGISADITVGSTIVKGGNGIKSELQQDGITYIVSVSGDYLTSANNSLSGKDLILRDNQWIELSATPEAKEYSGGEGIKVEDHIISVSGKYYPLNTNPSGYLIEDDLKDYAKSAWVAQEFQKKGNYITSAESSQDYLVLQDNIWVKMPNVVYTAGPFIDITDDNEISGYDWNPIIDQKLFTSSFNTYNSAYSAFIQNQFSSFSATVSATYIQSADIPVYSARNDYIDVIPDGNNYGLSGYDWNPRIDQKLYTSSFNTYSSVYNTYIEEQFSSFSSTISSTYIQSADIPVYSARNDYIKIVKAGDNYGVSGYDWNPELAEKLDVTATADWDVISYSAGNFIKIVNHKISGYDWTDEIAKKQDELTEYQLSAISSVSSKQDMLSNEQLSAISSVSAIQAFSGNWVTSATDVISEANLSYVLKKDGDSSKWEGVDLSEVGKTYKVESETPELLKVTSGDGNTTFTLSAKPYPEIPGISGYGTSAWYDEPNNQYKVSANISGNNGISAEYNSENNQWNIGISADACAYFAGLYATQAAITGGTLIPYESNTSQNITIDESGYIRLPDDGNKFTFCINETVENNISTAHNYCLNQISLIKVDENEANEPETIVSTHDYYPTEVGASDTNIALTIRHVPGYKYAVKYDGANLSDSVTMRSKISIIEEIVSLSNDSGQGSIYGGVEPVFVDNDSKLVGLSYDRNQFKAVVGADTAHPSLKALQLDIQTSGGTIDQEAFEKLANLVYGRITETIPIGMINAHDYLNAGQGWSYLFRPIMDFDVSQHTVARIMTHNASVNASKVLIVICRLDESSNKIYVEWYSNLTTLTKEKGTHTLTADPFCTETRTLNPDKLYYVVVLNLGQTTHFAGFKNDYNDDAGDYDIAYWTDNAHLYSTAIINYLNNVSVNSLGQTGNSKLKPYVGFRNEL